MRGSSEDLPATVEAKEAIVRETDWADIHVGFETYDEDSDIAPLFEGLPDDRCQCPHWGYVFEGRMRVRYADGEEVFEAGDAFYVSPGHTPFMEAGTEILVFSPKDEYRKTQEVAEANNEARQKPRKRTTHNPPWKAQKEGVRGDAVSAQGRLTRREVP